MSTLRARSGATYCNAIQPCGSWCEGADVRWYTSEPWITVLIRLYKETFSAARWRNDGDQSKTRLEMPNWPFIGTRNMKSHQPGGALLSTFAPSPSPSPTIQ